MIKNTFSILIIIFGASLDIYFYSYRFLSDGLLFPVALIISASMETLLALSVYNMKKNKLWLILACCITLYSVVQTSAGQTFVLLEYSENSGKQISSSENKSLLVDYKQIIKEINEETATIRKQLKSLSTTEERFTYRGTIYRANKRLAELEKNKKFTLEKIENLSEKSASIEKSLIADSSIYGFYSNIDSWNKKQLLKFCFHTILSIFIALMTPIGILTFSYSRKSKQNSKLKIQDIENYVNFLWYNIRAKTSDKITAENIFNDLMNKHKKNIVTGLYSEIVNLCLKNKCIDIDSKIIIKNQDAVVSIVKSEIFKRW